MSLGGVFGIPAVSLAAPRKFGPFSPSRNPPNSIAAPGVLACLGPNLCPKVQCRYHCCSDSLFDRQLSHCQYVPVEAPWRAS
jgi:hypothetical protein